jgi:hypothetical protein
MAKKRYIIEIDEGAGPLFHNILRAAGPTFTTPDLLLRWIAIGMARDVLRPPREGEQIVKRFMTAREA